MCVGGGGGAAGGGGLAGGGRASYRIPPTSLINSIKYRRTNARFCLSYHTKISFNSRFSHQDVKILPYEM